MPLTEEEIQSIQEENAKLKADLEAMNKPKDEPKPEPKPDEDKSLGDKFRDHSKKAEEEKEQTKKMEKAITFNITLQDFIKNNQGLVPKRFEEIVKFSEKENYESKLDKANSLRSEFVQSFFEVQENLDLLTASQKNTLDEYLKLTKNGKEQKAEFIFDNLFEPVLETLRKVKKAEDVYKARMGYSPESDMESNYKKKLMDISRKAYLNERG